MYDFISFKPRSKLIKKLFCNVINSIKLLIQPKVQFL